MKLYDNLLYKTYTHYEIINPNTFAKLYIRCMFNQEHKNKLNLRRICPWLYSNHMLTNGQINGPSLVGEIGAINRFWEIKLKKWVLSIEPAPSQVTGRWVIFQYFWSTITWCSRIHHTLIWEPHLVIEPTPTCDGECHGAQEHLLIFIHGWDVGWSSAGKCLFHW